MSEKRGIFSLEELYDLQVSGETAKIVDVFTYVKTGTPFGYFAGGYTALAGYSYQSAIQRVDYANDSISTVASFAYPGGWTNPAPSPSPGAQQVGSATGNLDFAYYCSGVQPASSEVLRYDYANDGTNATLRCLLTKSRPYSAATGNLNFGYVAGTSYDSSIDRIDYGNDTATATPKGNLGLSPAYIGMQLAAAGNLNYGYISGGYDPVYGIYSSYISRIDYANDSVGGSPKGNLGTGVSRHAAAGNADYSWHTGGYPGSKSIVQRIDYANDTSTTSPRGNLGAPMNLHAVTGNSTQAYTSGGYSPSYSQGNPNSYKIDYSNDTSTANSTGYSWIYPYYNVVGSSPLMNGFTSAPLTQNGVDIGGRGIPTTRAYFAGGFGPGYQRYSTVSRLNFDNDTATASTKGPLVSQNHQACGGDGNTTHGYVFLGNSPGDGSFYSPSINYRYISYISRIDYSNDSETAIRVGNFTGTYNSISETRAIGNNDFGYFITYGQSQIYRLDYANDTNPAPVKGSTEQTNEGSTVGNLNFGYLARDGSPSASNIDRIDYSNDEAATLVKGTLTSPAYAGAGVGNGNFGYFYGNQGPSSPTKTTISRIDYSNDTATASPKGNLAEGRIKPAATGSANFGYFGGGYSTYPSGPYSGVPSSYIISSTTRIDYANDTSTSSPKGNLPNAPSGAYSLTAMSTSDNGKTAISLGGRVRFTDEEPISTGNPLYNFGYFSGGANSKMILRLDYANDTTSPPSRGGLNTARNMHSSVSNADFGYFMGGRVQVGGVTTDYSSTERLDYSNDSETSSPKGNLMSSTTLAGSTSNLNYGWTGGNKTAGGYTSADPSNVPGTTVVQRIDFASDTATAAPKGPLNYSRFANTATGTLDYGWFAGGRNNSYTSAMRLVDRIDYSSDTTTADQKGNLSAAKSYHSAAGNASYGWQIGGMTNVPSSTRHIDRVDYANDTAQAAQASPAPSNPTTYGSATTGNRHFSYTTGIKDGMGSESRVFRYDYANDTNGLSQKSNTPSSYTQLASISATSALINGFPVTLLSDVVSPYAAPYNFPVQLDPPPPPAGYFAGGYNYNPSGSGNDVTKVERIDFSNDTATALIRGDISNVPGNQVSVTSNLTHGYIAGGHVVPVKSTISRIDYANDTATAAVKGPLSLARGQASAFGNKDYGYNAGGMNFIGSPSFSAIAYSTVDRIDYANDTVAASQKGPLSAATAYQSGGGNLSYGYYVGQSAPSGNFGPSSTRVERIDYSNDTAATSQRGNMDIKKATRAAAGNNNYGYFTTGYGPSPSYSNTSRIDYANDTATASPKGNFWVASYKAGGTGSSDYGYIAAGFTPSQGSSGDTTVGRIDYANDTVTAAQRGTMALPKATRPQGISSLANGLPS